MRKLAAIIVALALPFIPSAARADVALGANFGAGVDFREGRSGHFFIGLPYGFELPGFRFTAATESGRHEFYFDSSLVHSGPYTVDPNNRRVDSFTEFMLFVAYQHMFDPHSSNSFFFNAGGGPIVYSGPAYDTTTFMIGGGVGFQQRIAGGHGSFREELRLDFVPGRRDLPQAAILGFKFGFDLWFR